MSKADIELDPKARADALSIATAMLPAKHLAIFAAVKKRYPECQPSQVFRILAAEPQFDYSYVDGVFRHRRTA